MDFEVTKPPKISEQCQTLDIKTSKLLNDLLSNPKIVSKEDRASLGLKDLAVVSFSSLNHINEAV